MYKKVDSEVVERLREIVGADNVLVEAEDMEPYSHDEVVGLRADPEVVVKATSTEQVSQIFKLAQREQIPVTPRGAGMGLSGGAVPVCGGIILSLEKMNRILEIDKENLMVTVEPGVITGEHGIGAIRRKYLPLALDRAQIEIMEKIREVFDPNRILNPAKIFP